MARALFAFLRQPIRWLRALAVRDHAKQSLILLYMRSLEGTLRLRLGRSLLTGGKRAPVTMLTETLLGTPSTAHILGGACMGSGLEDGVINDRHEVFGYPGLRVIDGSAVSANPGVNPSLTITAFAERAISYVPKKPTPGP